ncbi:conserved hypothetical protein [Leptospira interrogans serovar Manilae]|uniref:Uncharacterized protein n=1 Tax=Leptospira interrogans serovar Manilae TaxID=214675 RepID=A0AAQ1NYM0_LEPIR|nr:conserved hypothetical protein [Leptospira interrogans serovar Manilae]
MLEINSPSVSVVLKWIIEAILLISIIELFNNSIVMTFVFELPYPIFDF